MKYTLLCITIMGLLALNGCENSQSVSADDAGIGNMVFTVIVDDNPIGSVLPSDMASHFIDVEAEGLIQKGIPVSELIRAVKPLSDADFDEFLGEYICDYESSYDGFRPSSKGERCPMVSCLYTKKSYVNVMSGRLFYDDDAPMTNGCYHVTDVHKVWMYKANPTAQIIWLYLNGEVVGRQVDIDLLEKYDINGKQAVRFIDVLDAAKIEVDLDLHTCDFRLDNIDKTLRESGTCGPIPCDAIENTYLYVDSRELSENEETAACGDISNIKAIYITQNMDHFDPHIINIDYNGSTYYVDISTLTDKAVIVNAVPSVKLMDVVEAAGIHLDDATRYLCDYAGEDGYKPADRIDCQEVLTCDRMDTTYVSLTEAHKLKMENAPSCYNVTWLVKIEIKPI